MRVPNPPDERNEGKREEDKARLSGNWPRANQTPFSQPHSRDPAIHSHLLCIRIFLLLSPSVPALPHTTPVCRSAVLPRPPSACRTGGDCDGASARRFVTCLQALFGFGTVQKRLPLLCACLACTSNSTALWIRSAASGTWLHGRLAPAGISGEARFMWPSPPECLCTNHLPCEPDWPSARKDAT